MKQQTGIHLLLTVFITTGIAGVSDVAFASGSHIEHIVLCWLKEPTEENRQKVIETSRELAAIPGVMELRAGPALPSERDIVDDSFDVGISMRFASRVDMENYLTHEEHVKRVRNILLPLCGNVRVHDFSF